MPRCVPATEIIGSMGSLLSSPEDQNYENLYIRNPKIGKYQYEFSCMNLSEEDVGKLYHKFMTIDQNKNGTIESKEFFNYFGISKSRFASRVFNYSDMSNIGRVFSCSFFASSFHQQEKLLFMILFLFHGTFVQFQRITLVHYLQFNQL